MRWLGLALSACVACGDAAFVCAQDADCTAGQAGVCQANGYCSFPDDGCTSGQRYADHSGALSSLCVDPEVGTSSSSEVTIGDDTVASLTSVPPESSDSVASLDDSADTTSAVSAGTTTTMPTSEASTSAATDSSSTGEPVDPDLLLWLRFEDGSELVNDGVVGGVATCEGGCPLQEDGIATFDGTDDCLVAPLDDAFSADAFTAAAWLWRNDEVDDFYFYVFGKSFGDVGDNSWELFVIPDDMLVPVLRAHIDAPVDVAVDMAMPASLEWIHVATTWDGVALRLWLDGEVVGQANAAAVSYDDHAVQIGCDDNGRTQEGYLGGRLDDVRVYSRALDEGEMAGLAAAGPP